MIRLTDDRCKVAGSMLGALWIGDSEDEQSFSLVRDDIKAILNVAQDLDTSHKWEHKIECMHVGLIDGPGNDLTIYYAAILALHGLLRRYNTLVCCHTGGRSLAVAIMYLNVIGNRDWNWWMEILSERSDDFPSSQHLPNQVHKEAFSKLDWKLLRQIMGAK